MHRCKLASASAALLTTVLLAGCGQDQEAGGMAGVNHGTATGSPSASRTSVNAGDEMFVTMMIPHHEQAIEMADLILGKQGIDQRVVTLAQQIKAAQAPEIETMRGWLTEWGVGGVDASDHGGHGGGMLSDRDMAALNAATGVEASRLFLTGMIGHHNGAIEMAETAVDDGRDPEVLKLAGQVITGQRAEAATMRTILDSL